MQNIIIQIKVSTMTQINQSTTYSQKRAQQLLQRSDRIAKIFNINNFYDNNQINVNKLKQKIDEAKKKLLAEKQKEKQQETSKNKQIKNTKDTKLSKNKDVEHDRKKNVSVMSTGDQVREFRDFGVGNHKVRRTLTRGNQHNHSKISAGKIEKRIPRLATDLGQYQINRKNSYMYNDRLSTINDVPVRPKSKHHPQDSRHFRFISQESPGGNSKSAFSAELEHRKIVLGQIQHFKQFQMKIALLWELYEIIVNMMQNIAKSDELDQKIVLDYVKCVSSHKYEFVHQICDLFAQTRVQRFIRLSRILQNFSVFQMCLNSIGRKKGSPTQIINYLGYSSSSVIFLIKILLLSHETAFTFSQHTQSIINSIIQFEISSYKSEIRNIKDVLRRLEHNNEIIGMIKNRCGKKHGKYCQQFINKIIKSVDKIRTPFYQCANNIFEFLSFYLHFENISGSLPLLATPPSPFLSLAYSKTIIIDPWCVLANRKNNKLVIRAHAGKFLAQVSDSCNLIFWTQFMPKDAQILTNLFPVKQNVYWLYRYHCRQQNQFMIKLIDLVGCITENTIVIDSIPEHYAYNPDIGVSMYWRGQKKDTKLLNLSSIIQYIFEEASKNKTNLRQQLQKVRFEIESLNKKMVSSKSIKFRSRG